MTSSVLHPRLGCSTISFRHLSLQAALERIAEIGFHEVDLGALPGVCTHVPMPLAAHRLHSCAVIVERAGVRVRAINADIGALNDPELRQDDLRDRLRPLVDLAREIQAAALLLPAGDLDRAPKSDLRTDVRRLAITLDAAQQRCAEAGIDLLVEAPHHYRLCHDLATTTELVRALNGTRVGMVLDASHVVAAGDNLGDAIELMGSRLRHVHLRDAVRGDINRSLGRGAVDFPEFLRLLNDSGYDGPLSLELETHDITDDQRPEETARAGHWITELLNTRENA